MRHGPIHEPRKRNGAESMYGGRRWPSAFLVLMTAAGLVAVGQPAMAATAPNSFRQTNLVASKASFGAKLLDPNPTHAWGLASSPSSPLLVSDNNSGFATVYTGGYESSTQSLCI